MAGLRHDTRAPAQDKFGKPGSSFPYGTQDYPRVIEEGTVRKGKATPPYLTPHPDNPSLLLVGIQRAKGDDADAVETRAYERLPGPPIVSTGYNERGESTTTITQTVLTNSEPPVEVMGYLYDSATKVAQDALRSTLTITTVDQRKPLYAEDAFTVNRSLMRHITGTPRTTYTCIVPVGTDPDADFFVVESNVKDLNVWEALKTTQRAKYFTRFRSSQCNEQLGGVKTETYERVISSGTKASGTLTLNTNPVAGDPITINDQVNPIVVFTLKTSVSSITDILLGVDAVTTAANISAAIDTYVALDVHASNSGSVVTVESNGVGTLGNSVTLATTSAAITLSGSTLAGGTAPTPTALSVDTIKSSIEDYDGTHALQTVETLAPGETFPTFTTQRMNDRLGVIVTEARTPKAKGSISTGYTIAPNGSSLTVVEMEPYPRNKALAWEVVTTYPLPPAHSYETAILGQTWDAIRFPARLMTTTGSSYESNGDSYRSTETTRKEVITPTAELVPATTHRWYVFSDTRPTIEVPSIILQPQEYTSLVSSFTGDNGKYGNSTQTSIGEFLSSTTSPTDAEYLGYSYVSANYVLNENSNQVIGNSTNFLNDFKAGDVIGNYSGYQALNSGSVGNITLSSEFRGPTGHYTYKCFYTTGSQSYEYDLTLTHGSTVVTINSQTLIASAVGAWSGVFWDVGAVVASIEDNTHLTLENIWYGVSGPTSYNSKKTYEGTPWVAQEKIRKANIERPKPGLYECNAISVLMR